jgi:hypothetical protein
VLTKEDAVRCMQLLVESPSGRALLSRGGFASKTTSLLAEGAHKALDAAVNQLNPDKSTSGVTDPVGQVEGVQKGWQQAVAAIGVYAKVSMLLLTCPSCEGVGDEQLDFEDVCTQVLGKGSCGWLVRIGILLLMLAFFL